MTSRAEAADLGRMIGLGSLLSYMYCLMASMSIVQSPLFGGALYMCAEISAVFFSTFGQKARGVFSRGLRRWRIGLLAVLLLSTLSLVLIYPTRLSNEQAWLVFALIAAMLLRDITCDYAARLNLRGALGRKGYALMMTACHLIPAAALLIIFPANLPADPCWLLLGGYAICDLATLWFELRARSDETALRRSGNEDVAAQLRDALKGAAAYRMYEVLVFLIVVALEVTTVMVFSEVARHAENLLVALGACVGVGFLAYVISETLLDRRQRKREQLSDPTNVLLLGLVLWLYGLLSFRGLKSEDMLRLRMYLSLGLTVAGCSLCLSAVGWLERSMRAVARFAAGHEPEGFDRMRASSMDVAALVGQVLALGLMTVMIFADAGRHGTLKTGVQPLLMMPALVLVVIALICLLRFPIYARTLGKLSRLEKLKDSSQQSAIRTELKQTVALSKDRPFFGRIARWLIRRLYPHRLVGTENIRPDEDNPIVFLCNHGELYGPLVAEGNLPVPARLWVISNMAVNPEEVTEYLYHNTFSRQRWIPRRLRMPVSRFMARFSVWGMDQLGGIPVWRDKPVLLKRTFRATVEAMLAGDNILIFPENPHPETEEGYSREGVGDLFSGFAMLGQLYWMRTGKRCRFLPMLCHKGTRTVTFGEEILWDPEAPAEAEIQRVSDACGEWMKETWKRCEADAASEKKKGARTTPE